MHEQARRHLVGSESDLDSRQSGNRQQDTYSSKQAGAVARPAYRALLSLLACMFMITISGCSDPDPVEFALGTMDSSKGRAAVERISDQEELAEVALRAVNLNVRQAAAQKLIDQKVLAKFISRTRGNPDILRACFERLTDQELLAKVAIEMRDSEIRRAAVCKVTDQAALARIFFEAEDNGAGYAAFMKLTTPELLEKVAADHKNKSVQLIYKFIRGFDSVPEWHRNRLMGDMLPAFRVLNDPEVVKELGEIVSIKADWSSRRKTYSTPDGTKLQAGERFGFLIGVTKQPRQSAHSWETYYPEFQVYVQQLPHFRPANVHVEDLLGPAFGVLSQGVLTRISLEEGRHNNVRKAAVQKLTDETVLANIVREDKDLEVRQAAQKRLDMLHRTGQN